MAKKAFSIACAAILLLILCSAWSCGLFSMDIVQKVPLQRISAETGKLDSLMAGKNSSQGTSVEVITSFDAKNLDEVESVRFRNMTLFIADRAAFEQRGETSPVSHIADTSPSPASSPAALPDQTAGHEDTAAAGDSSGLFGGEDSSLLGVLGDVFGVDTTPKYADNTGCPDVQNFNFFVSMRLEVASLRHGSKLPPLTLAANMPVPRCAKTLTLPVNTSINLAKYYREGMLLRTIAEFLPVRQTVYFAGNIVIRVEIL